MRYVLMLAVTLSLLTACSTVHSSPQQRASALALPTVVTYDRETQAAAAQELKDCADKCTVVKRLLKDFKTMRDETRAAIKHLTK